MIAQNKAVKASKVKGKLIALKRDVRFKFGFVWRVLTDMPPGELFICSISTMLFFFFLFSNRFLHFFTNIRHTITGTGDPVFLLLDGFLIIMMLIAVYLMINHLLSYDMVLPQTHNHEAIKEVVLPSYIRSSYLPINERLKIIEDETNIITEVDDKNDKIGQLLVGDPSLLENIEELFAYGINQTGESDIEPINVMEEERIQKAATMELAAGLASILRQGPLDEGIEAEHLTPELVYDVAKALDLIEEKVVEEDQGKPIDNKDSNNE